MHTRHDVKEKSNRENIHISYENRVEEYHRLLATLVSEYTPSGGAILDFGCGMGTLLNIIHTHNKKYTLHGADIDPRCLQETKKHVPNAELFLVDQNNFDISLFDIYYDTCVMSHILEHMLSPYSELMKIMSIIKPGGHLILAVPNPSRPEVIIGNIFKRHYANIGHAYAWDRSHWINFLENVARLNVVQYSVDEVRCFPARIGRTRILRGIELAIAKVLPWFSFSNIAVIQKDKT